MISQLLSKSIALSLAVFLTLTLGFFLGRPVDAQVAGAMLQGTISDPSGGVIPQTRISIKNVATGVVTEIASDSAGFYAAPNLLPGLYELKASASGFVTIVQSGITLTVGAQQVLNLTMTVGQVSQTVEVTTEAPTVELASSTIGNVVNSNTVVELPLNGRDWTNLATLQPGVNTVVNQQSLISANSPRANRGYGNQMSISGTRPQANNYRVDGVSIMDYVNTPAASVNGITLGVDSIAEFSALTANTAAEYGRTSGGIINASTRSGTNQFHGNAYWFIRDEDFDSLNAFDSRTAPKPGFHRNQYGGSVGGPIQKDKTFFFADFERFLNSRGTTFSDTVFSPNARNGILNFADPSQFPAGCVATSVANQCKATINPLVVPYLAFYPLPNGPLVGPLNNTGQYNQVSIDNGEDWFGTVRIDRKFSDKDSIFGTYRVDDGFDKTPDAFNNVLIGSKQRDQTIVLEETHIFSATLVNSVRVGFNRVANDTLAPLTVLNPLTTNTSLGSFPGRTAPQIKVPAITNFGGGTGGSSENLNRWDSTQFYDDAFLTKGVHSLKFGFGVERMRFNKLASANGTGAFTFGSLTDFLLFASPSAFTGGQLLEFGGNRQNLFAGYLQDDWRVRPNLTVNLGLRYETVTAPSNLNPPVGTQLANPTDPPSNPYLGDAIFNPYKLNFEPRVGFAWDPFRNGKTSVRGAFGMFDFFALPGYFSPRTAPVSVTAGATGPNTFPTAALGNTNAIPASARSFFYYNLDPRRNYVMIWNLNVQRELTPNTTMTVGYIGNKSVHMLTRFGNTDIVLPTTTPEGLFFPGPAGVRLNNFIAGLNTATWDGFSKYDALTVNVVKKLSHGFQVEGSYTWGKNIDSGSGATVSDPYSNSISSLLLQCVTCRTGLSDFNIGQTLVLNAIWNLPAPKNWGNISSHVLGGWQVGGIFTAETGTPFTPTIAGDAHFTKSNDPFGYPNWVRGCNPVNSNYRTTLQYINLSCFSVPMASANNAAQCTAYSAVPGSCRNLFGNEGRNSITGPGIGDLDFSLLKDNYITRVSESFNVQLRAEIFNILNRANYQAPLANSALFQLTGAASPGAGVINATSTFRREMQFAVKVIF